VSGHDTSAPPHMTWLLNRSIEPEHISSRLLTDTRFMAPIAALFFIDIQKGIADDPEHEIPAAARIRTAGAKILETARRILDTSRAEGPSEGPGALIVFIQHEEPPEDGPLNRGSELWKLVFEPRDDVSEEWLVQKKDGRTNTSSDSDTRPRNW